MLLPDEKSRPRARAALHDDQLGGGVKTDSTSSTLADEVCDAAELVVAGAVMSPGSGENAGPLLALAPVEAFRHPVARFVITVAHRLLEETVAPSPLSVVDWALKNGVQVPVRDTPVAELSKLVSRAYQVGPAAWAAREVQSNHFRRLIAEAGQRISAAAWSDTAELAELANREIAAIKDAVTAVTG